jgi:hypothetical protein
MADTPIPSEITHWMNNLGWGDHHLRWHIERRWDRFEYRDQFAHPTSRVIPWAISQGWSRYEPQEGAPDNGIEFLAMHRAMLLALTQQFPQHAALFTGWTQVPMAVNDPNDPVPVNPGAPLPGALSQAYQDAAARLQSQPESFASEDALGVYMQTTDLPTPANPLADSPEAGAGIHNHLHGRFTLVGSPINIGNPQVNIQNQRFWRLHGWINQVWSGYRSHGGLSDEAPAYVAALRQGAQHMRVEDLLFPTGGVAPAGENHHHLVHPPIVVPPAVMQQVLKWLYFCPADQNFT